jgi:RND superfamily putative drug exporter
MTIVPAVLALLGERAWSLPARIDRILPNVDIEGEKLAHHKPPSPSEGQPGHTLTHERSGQR